MGISIYVNVEYLDLLCVRLKRSKTKNPGSGFMEMGNGRHE